MRFMTLRILLNIEHLNEKKGLAITPPILATNDCAWLGVIYGFMDLCIYEALRGEGTRRGKSKPGILSLACKIETMDEQPLSQSQ